MARFYQALGPAIGLALGKAGRSKKIGQAVVLVLHSGWQQLWGQSRSGRIYSAFREAMKERKQLLSRSVLPGAHTTSVAQKH